MRRRPAAPAHGESETSFARRAGRQARSPSAPRHCCSGTQRTRPVCQRRSPAVDGTTRRPRLRPKLSVSVTLRTWSARLSAEDYEARTPTLPDNTVRSLPDLLTPLRTVRVQTSIESRRIQATDRIWRSQKNTASSEHGRSGHGLNGALFWMCSTHDQLTRTISRGAYGEGTQERRRK